MNRKEALERLTQKFTSGNNVPIDIARITREEFEALQEDKRGKNKCKHETVHDLFERYICNNCGELFFDNPKQ